VIQAQIRSGWAGLVDNSSLSQGAAIQARPIALCWPVQMRSSLGQKRLLDTLNAESKRRASGRRDQPIEEGGVCELSHSGLGAADTKLEAQYCTKSHAILAHSDGTDRAD
jgi:hypothetical protein